MLKKLLAGIAVVTFVVGLSGIANARFCGENECKTEINTEYVLDLELNTYWEDMVLDNIVGICQDGDYNVVDLVWQDIGSNLLTGSQDGNSNYVLNIWQYNTDPAVGMNVITITQDGNNNGVTNVTQTQ